MEGSAVNGGKEPLTAQTKECQWSWLALSPLTHIHGSRCPSLCDINSAVKWRAIKGLLCPLRHTQMLMQDRSELSSLFADTPRVGMASHVLF